MAERVSFSEEFEDGESLPSLGVALLTIEGVENGFTGPHIQASQALQARGYGRTAALLGELHSKGFFDSGPTELAIERGVKSAGFCPKISTEHISWNVLFPPSQWHAPLGYPRIIASSCDLWSDFERYEAIVSNGVDRLQRLAKSGVRIIVVKTHSMGGLLGDVILRRFAKTVECRDFLGGSGVLLPVHSAPAFNPLSGYAQSFLQMDWGPFKDVDPKLAYASPEQVRETLEVFGGGIVGVVNEGRLFGRDPFTGSMHEYFDVLRDSSFFIKLLNLRYGGSLRQVLSGLSLGALAHAEAFRHPDLLMAISEEICSIAGSFRSRAVEAAK